MKKLIFILIASVFTTTCYQAQTFSASDEMHIYNYTHYTMGGHVMASKPTTCYPTVTGGFDQNIFPTGDPLGRDIVMYKKFNNSHLTTIPISIWTIKASATTSAFNLPSSSPLLINPYAQQTRWSGILVEYWDNNGTVNSGFGLNIVNAAQGDCSQYPMTYFDPVSPITVESFYIDDNYYVIMM